MKMMGVPIALLACGLAGNAHAGPITGAQLQGYCQNYTALAEHRDYNELQAGLCIGQITGVVEALIFIDAMAKTAPGAKPDGNILCVPSGGSPGQSFQIVQKFLKENPEMLDQQATGLVFIAIRKAWGCAASQ